MLIRKTVYSLFKKHRINDLNFTLDIVQEFADDNRWQLYTYSVNKNLITRLELVDRMKLDAFTYITSDEVMIFYNDALPKNDIIFNIFHEYGHLFLKHKCHDNIAGYHFMLDVTMRQENEANEFACEMLAPTCIFKQMNVTSIEEVSKISILPVKYIKEHLVKINNFDDFDNLSQDVIDIFNPYIKKAKKLVKKDPEQMQKILEEQEKKILEFYKKDIEEINKFREEENIKLKEVQNKIKEEKSKNTKKIVISSILVLIGFIALFIFNSLNKNKTNQAIIQDIPLTTVVETTTEVVTEKLTELTTQEIVNNPVTADSVYTTKSGNKYHLPSCSYIKNKDDLVEHSILDIDKVKYSPCSRCIKK